MPAGQVCCPDASSDVGGSPVTVNHEVVLVPQADRGYRAARERVGTTRAILGVALAPVPRAGAEFPDCADRGSAEGAAGWIARRAQADAAKCGVAGWLGVVLVVLVGGVAGWVGVVLVVLVVLVGGVAGSVDVAAGVVFGPVSGRVWNGGVEANAAPEVRIPVRE